MAHVARRGDISANSGEWIAGPTKPATLEGVQITWNAPSGLALEYQVLASGAGGRWSIWVSSGEFAGTRGRSLPLTGVRLRLSGAGADAYQLRGQALFLGSSVMTQEGREIELVSMTGIDPLVGLRLEVGISSSHRSEAAAVQPRAEQVPARSRIRVFSSSEASTGAKAIERVA
jgi:hypothetical protein